MPARTRSTGELAAPKPPSPREQMERDLDFMVERILGVHPSRAKARRSLVEKMMKLIDEAAKE